MNEYKTQLEQWIPQQIRIHFSQKEMLFNEREIWLCALGVNIGHEQNGVSPFFSRPVLIIKKFNQHTALCIPLTSKQHQSVYQEEFTSPLLHKKSFLMFDQIKCIDTRRLKRKFGKISEKKLEKIKQKSAELIQAPPRVPYGKK